MIIYGVALLAICMLAGTLIGEWLGIAIGLDVNVGGVGIAMLILVVLVNSLKQRGKLDKDSQKGLSFWGGMYIPIVVAMAAQQNVAGAIKGGPMAVLAGVVTVIICFAAVPILSNIGKGKGSIESFDNEKIDAGGFK